MIALYLMLGLATPAQPTDADLLLGAIDVVISPMSIAAVDLSEARAIEVATDTAPLPAGPRDGRGRHLRVCARPGDPARSCAA